MTSQNSTTKGEGLFPAFQGHKLICKLDITNIWEFTFFGQKEWLSKSWLTFAKRG